MNLDTPTTRSLKEKKNSLTDELFYLEMSDLTPTNIKKIKEIKTKLEGINIYLKSKSNYESPFEAKLKALKAVEPPVKALKAVEAPRKALYRRKQSVTRKKVSDIYYINYSGIDKTKLLFSITIDDGITPITFVSNGTIPDVLLKLKKLSHPDTAASPKKTSVYLSVKKPRKQSVKKSGKKRGGGKSKKKTVGTLKPVAALVPAPPAAPAVPASFDRHKKIIYAFALMMKIYSDSYSAKVISDQMFMNRNLQLYKIPKTKSEGDLTPINIHPFFLLFTNDSKDYETRSFRNMCIFGKSLQHGNNVCFANNIQMLFVIIAQKINLYKYFISKDGDEQTDPMVDAILEIGKTESAINIDHPILKPDKDKTKPLTRFSVAFSVETRPHFTFVYRPAKGPILMETIDIASHLSFENICDKAKKVALLFFDGSQQIIIKQKETDIFFTEISNISGGAVQSMQKSPRGLKRRRSSPLPVVNSSGITTYNYPMCDLISGIILMNVFIKTSTKLRVMSYLDKMNVISLVKFGHDFAKSSTRVAPEYRPFVEEAKSVFNSSNEQHNTTIGEGLFILKSGKDVEGYLYFSVADSIPPSTNGNLFHVTADVCKLPSLYIPQHPYEIRGTPFESCCPFFEKNALSLYNAGQVGTRECGVDSPDQDSSTGIGTEDMEIFSLIKGSRIYPIEFTYNVDGTIPKKYKVTMRAVNPKNEPAKGKSPCFLKSRTIPAIGLKYMDEEGRIHNFKNDDFFEVIKLIISGHYPAPDPIIDVLNDFNDFCTSSNKSLDITSFSKFAHSSSTNPVGILIKKLQETYDDGGSYAQEFSNFLTYAHQVSVSCKLKRAIEAANAEDSDIEDSDAEDAKASLAAVAALEEEAGGLRKPKRPAIGKANGSENIDSF